MRLFRQLGTCGTAALLAPILWAGLCLGARTLGQHAYETNVTPWTRAHRVGTGPELDLPFQGRPPDPRVRTELSKYLKVWSLEPGACAAFPNGARLPFSWNPLRASALMVRLKQKQAFLMTQRHRVLRRSEGTGERWYLAPDAGAALGGRRFLLRARGEELLDAVEL